MISGSINFISVRTEAHHLRSSTITDRKYSPIKFNSCISRIHLEKHELLQSRRILQSNAEIYIRAGDINHHGRLVRSICNINLMLTCSDIWNHQYALIAYDTLITSVQENTGSHTVACNSNGLEEVAPCLHIILLTALKIDSDHIRFSENIMMEIETCTGAGSHLHNDAVSPSRNDLSHDKDISTYCPDTDSCNILSSHAGHMNLHPRTLPV